MKSEWDITDFIGKIGFYQIGLFLIVASMAFFAGKIDSISMNFLGGFQDHWCAVEQLANFSHAQQKYISIPYNEDQAEHRDCEMFPFNWSSFSQEDFYNWNRTAMTEGLTADDYVDCNQGWVFDQSEYVSTIGSEMGLVCDSRWQVEMVNTIYMFGRLIGAVTCGFVSDILGRKLGMMSYHIIRIVSTFICLYTTSYWAFALGRFLMAIGATGATLCAYVLLLEFTHKKYRGIVGTLWFVVSSLGYMSICVMAYLVRDYDKLQTALYYPQLVYMLFFICTEESPKWLMSKGRVNKALQIIQYICKINNMPIPEKLQLESNEANDIKGGNHTDIYHNEIAHEKDLEKDAENQTSTGECESTTVTSQEIIQARFLDLFKTPKIRLISMIVFLCWFSNSLVYYGLSLNSGRLAGDVYLNSFLMGATEIPANLFVMWYMNAYGRKWATGIPHLLAGVTSFLCVPLLLIVGPGTAVTTLSILGKACITASFTGVYVYTVELFPTPVRSIAMGTSSMCARISGMMAPFVGGPLENIWLPLPSLVFGLTATLAGILVLFLPETLGRKLPDTIDEVEKFSSKNAVAPVMMEMEVKQHNELESKLTDSPTEFKDCDTV